MKKTKIRKSFKLPKRQESKDNLRHVDVKSRDCLEILDLVQHTYVNSNFKTTWTVKGVALVENRELEEKYRAKKADMKEEGRHSRDLADNYAVFICRDSTAVPIIVKQGLKCRGQPFNGLGDSKSGLYLWRNADVQLRMAEGWGMTSITMMVFKIMLGKCKTIAPPSGGDNALMEPTPNYDCHLPQNTARPSDSLSTQIARSQIYLYEYTDDCEPATYPRQCLPYAVVVYDKTESVKKSLKPPVDMYSLRPSERQRAETSKEIDTAKQAELKKTLSKRDPRLATSVDSKGKDVESGVKVSDGMDTGLCVPRLSSFEPITKPSNSPQLADDMEMGLCMPRLTSGLPVQRDKPATVTTTDVLPESDPMSQLSFLTSEGPLKQMQFHGTQYQPSFGPSDEEEEEEQVIQDLSELLKKPKLMPSLPPLHLPVITDTRQLTDPRFEVRQSDPRRLASVDPRLKTTSNPKPNRSVDPKLANKARDPRLNRPQDPRLNRATATSATNDPRAESLEARTMNRDPRLAGKPSTEQQPSRRHQLNRDPRRPLKSSLRQSSTADDAAKSRKKLSLKDYQKKVNVEKAEPEVNEQPIHEDPFGLGDDDCMEDLDMRQPYVQPPFIEPMMPHHADIIMNPNVNVVKYPTSQNTNVSNVEEVSDESPESITIDEEEHEDMVHQPDDMARELNELSDPDDVSQSPKHLSEAEMTDPALAEAMKMLVENSANVNLFTDALKSLQDSAEEYGEQLHDPEFLVKKIAEKIEALTAEQLENERLEAERKEQERLAEKQEKERKEAERLEKERLAKKILKAEQIEKERKERQRKEVERRERDRQERERERKEAEAKRKLEAERRQKERREAEEREREQYEAERKEREKLQAERREIERALAEKAKKAKLEAERLEQERIQAEIERQRIHDEMMSGADEAVVSRNKSPTEEIMDIQSPDSIKSPDNRSNDSNHSSETSVKCIPLENTDQASKTKDSLLAQAMEKTLKEFHQVESRKDREKDSGRNRRGKRRFSKQSDTDVVNIQLPSVDSSSLQTCFPNLNKPPSSKIKGMRERIEVPMDLVSDDDEGEDVDFRSGFPAHNNILTDYKSKVKQKSQIKIKLNIPLSKAVEIESPQSPDDKQSGPNLTNKSSVLDSEHGRNAHNSGNDKRSSDFDMFQPDCDVDGRMHRDNRHSDPFGLGLAVDVDERVRSKHHVSRTRNTPAAHGDHFQDVDLRAADSSAENSQDFDFRQSHSRSSTPPLLARKPKVIDSFRRVDDKHARRSTSIDSEHDHSKTSDRNYEHKTPKDVQVAAMSHDSNDGTSMLFDAYSLGKTDKTKTDHPSNDYGDVDWRMSSTAGHADFDMRASQSGNDESSAANSKSYQPFSSSHLNSDPFNQLNKSIQNMFSPKASTSIGSFKLGNEQNRDNSITTSANFAYNSHVGSYNMGDYHTSNESYNLPTQSRDNQQKTEQFKGQVQSFIKNVDLGNLKDILAIVQQPNSSNIQGTPWMDSNSAAKDSQPMTDYTTGITVQNTQSYTVEHSVTESPMSPDAQEDSLPFIPGLDVAPSRSKTDSADKTIANVSETNAPFRSVVSENSDSKRQVKFGISQSDEPRSSRKDRFDSNKSDPTEFASIYDSDEADSDGHSGNILYDDVTFTDEEPVINDKRRVKLKDDDQATSKKFGDRPSTPQDKRLVKLKDSDIAESYSTPNRRKLTDDFDQEMTPLPNISYQSALLESMEQSALKVRLDDSIVSDVHEEESAMEEQTSEATTHSERSDRKRAYTDSADNSPATKVSKTEAFYTQDNDSDDDDDDGGLVIDLSPGDKTANDQAEEEDTKTAPVQQLELFHEDDIATPKTKDEMTSMIEKSRKNMVIKMKGEVKKVNPKTGKMYDENAKGSAIQVLGQSVKPSTDVKEHKISTVKTTARVRPHSPTHVSSISTVVAGRTRATSPITIVSEANIQSPVSYTAGSVLSVPPTGLVQPNSFIHPLTGQPIQYGPTQPGMAYPVVHSQVPTITTSHIRPLLPLLPHTAHIVPHTGLLPDPSALSTPPQTTIPPQQTVTGNPAKASYNSQVQQTGMPIQTVGGGTRQNVKPSASQPAASYSEKQSSSSVTSAKSANDIVIEIEDDDDESTTSVPSEKQKPSVKSTMNIKNEKNDEKTSTSVNKQLTPSDKRTSQARVLSSNAKKIKTEEDGKKLRKEFGNKILESLSEVKNVIEISPTKEPVKVKKEPVKKSQKEFGSRILESLSEIKNVIEISPTKEPVKVKKEPVKKIEAKVKPKEESGAIVIDSGESELEDGEISDDSDGITIINIQLKDSSKPSTSKTTRQSKPSRSQIVTHNLPKRTVPMQQAKQPARQGNIGRGAKQTASVWSDIIQNPGATPIERIKVTSIESPSMRESSNPEQTDLLSKSVASISKSKQKIVAQSQVKTLGDWLKLELETENIKPLESIIPYSLNTDLSIVPKARRRKIKQRVKTLIEQEGLKRAKEEDTPAAAVATPAAINPNYAPELHNDELEKELQLVTNSMKDLCRNIQQTDRHFFGGGQFGGGAVHNTFAARMALVNDKKLMAAMTLLEGEMKQLLTRTCFFGYPHRRVPAELLLISEMNTFKSNEEDVFLILMMPISARPYNKLLQMKNSLDDLYASKVRAESGEETQEIEKAIQTQHGQRQSLLRSFTGYLNKKRIQKIQETADKYTLVYEHFKTRVPPIIDTMLKHIRTTQMDLRQHLILAKQYMIMAEAKG